MRERIIDADHHILEPQDIWQRWLPERWQEKAPKLVKDADGGDAWLFAGSSTPDPIGLVTTPGKQYDEYRWTGLTYDDARPGCYLGAERLRDMDDDGIDAALIFPPQRTANHFLGDEDDDFVRAGVEAYNNFMWEEFCVPDRARLVGLAQIGTTGIDDSVDTLLKAKARGFKGVILGGWPSALDTISDVDDAFWAAACAEDMPIAIHIFMKGRAARIADRQATSKAGGPAYYQTKNTAPPATRAKAIGGLANLFGTVPDTISQFIFSGVFDRHPTLRVALIETGVGWIPHFLESMDDRYWRNRGWGGIDLANPPSYYWFSNMAASYVSDPVGIRLRYDVGVDNMMWSSDYPHHVNDWPYSRKLINLTLGGVAAEERAKIIGGNAARIFGL